MDRHFNNAPEWPASPEIPEATGSVPGHNRPAVDEMARDDFNALLDERQGFRTRIADLAASAERAVCGTDEEAGRCGELIKQIRAAEKVIEDAHRDTKAPYLAASRAIDDCKNTVILPLSRAKQSVQTMLNTFAANKAAEAAAERRRRQQEEQERQKQERERLAAEGQPEPEVAPVAAAAAEAPIVRGDYGAAVSTRKEWTFEITDFETALLEVAGNAKVREAVEKAIGALVRGGERSIKGVNIFQAVKAGVR